MENEAFFGSPTGQGWQLQSIGLPWGESSLCSIVSPPSTDPPPTAVAGDSVVIPELISRLGGTCTCTCDGISSSSSLDSPKNLDISVLTNPPSAAAHTPFSTDPGFAGTPKRCFIFAGRGGELSRVPSNQSLKSSGSAKRRKAAPRRKTKEAPLCSSVSTATNPHKVSLKTPWEEDGNANRSKIKEGSGDEKDVDEPKAPSRKPEEEEKEEKTTKRPESPRDYIHVRARRGQATDSHSLAERVRREKISERMKLLQDLVPGCNKVTGKAVMLDEIINYVQALQGQVEFLSMKLAMIYPQVEFNMDIHGLCEAVSPLEVTSTGQSSLNLQLPPIELGAFWEDDLQTVVQMGFGNMMADACKASYTIDWLS